MITKTNNSYVIPANRVTSSPEAIKESIYQNVRFRIKCGMSSNTMFYLGILTDSQNYINDDKWNY